MSPIGQKPTCSKVGCRRKTFEKFGDISTLAREMKIPVSTIAFTSHLTHLTYPTVCLPVIVQSCRRCFHSTDLESHASCNTAVFSFRTPESCAPRHHVSRLDNQYLFQPRQLIAVPWPILLAPLIVRGRGEVPDSSTGNGSENLPKFIHHITSIRHRTPPLKLIAGL